MYSCRPFRLKSSYMLTKKKSLPITEQTLRLKNSQDLSFKASASRDLFKHIKSEIFKYHISLSNVRHFSISCKYFSWSSAAQLHQQLPLISHNVKQTYISLHWIVTRYWYHYNKWRQVSTFITDILNNVMSQHLSTFSFFLQQVEWKLFILQTHFSCLKLKVEIQWASPLGIVFFLIRSFNVLRPGVWNHASTERYMDIINCFDQIQVLSCRKTVKQIAYHQPCTECK